MATKPGGGGGDALEKIFFSASLITYFFISNFWTIY